MTPLGVAGILISVFVVTPIFLIAGIVWTQLAFKRTGPSQGGAGEARGLVTYGAAWLQEFAFLFVLIWAQVLPAIGSFFIFIGENWKLIIFLVLTAGAVEVVNLGQSEIMSGSDQLWTEIISRIAVCTLEPLFRLFRIIFNALDPWSICINRGLSEFYWGTFTVVVSCGEVSFFNIVDATADVLVVAVEILVQWIHALVMHPTDGATTDLNVELLVRGIQRIPLAAENFIICTCRTLRPLWNALFEIVLSPDLARAIDRFVNTIIQGTRETLAWMIIAIRDSFLGIPNRGQGRPTYRVATDRLDQFGRNASDWLDHTLQVLYVTFIGGIDANQRNTVIPNVTQPIARAITTVGEITRGLADVIVRVDLAWKDSYLSCARQCSECIRSDLVNVSSTGVETWTHDECFQCNEFLRTALPDTSALNNSAACRECLCLLEPAQLNSTLCIDCRRQASPTNPLNVGRA